MSVGYYYSRNKVYYGSYDETVVSGGGLIKAEKMREYGFGDCIEDQKVVRFYANHRILDAEFNDFENALARMKEFQNINVASVSFDDIEKKLGVELPKEVKLLYTAINGFDEYFNTAIHFIPLDEIYIDQGILVICKKKRTPISGIDLNTRRQAFYIKKNWDSYEGNESCYLSWICYIFMSALESKAVTRKGRLKGRLVSSLHFQKDVKEKVCDQFNVLEEYDTYTNMILYSEDGTVALLRSNGSYGDLFVGADSDEQIDQLGELLEQVTWK